ncbi:MAG: hypothetical protein ACK5JO_14575 [Halodesulfovibrio sp.]
MKGATCYTWPATVEDTMLCVTYAEANMDCPCAEWGACKTSCAICNRPRTIADTLSCIPYAEAGVECPCSDEDSDTSTTQ